MGINIPNNINVIKKIYRALVNKMIHKYDCSGIVDAGGIAALNNLLEINDGKIYKMTETWIHPDMLDGRLIDRFYPDNIIEFKRRMSVPGNAFFDSFVKFRIIAHIGKFHRIHRKNFPVGMINGKGMEKRVRSCCP